jgi:hypothetical protein
MKLFKKILIGLKKLFKKKPITFKPALLKHKYYKSIEVLPVWNLYKVQKTGDLRYLLILDDYINLPKVNIDLSEVYQNILLQFEELDLKVQSMYLECWYYYNQYKIGDIKNQKANNSFAKYITYLDRIYENYQYDNQIFETSKDMYIHFKQKYTDFEQMIFLRLFLFDYRTLKADSKNKTDLYDEIINLREIIPNQPLEMKKTTVFEYLRLKKFVKEKTAQIQKESERLKSRKKDR